MSDSDIAMTNPDLVVYVQGLRDHRSLDDLPRRVLKIFEEGGELSRALLSLTHPANPRESSRADIREEAIDIVLVALDCALTPLPNESISRVVDNFWFVVRQKIAKWEKQIAEGTDLTGHL